MDLSKLSAAQIGELQKALTPRLNKYIPITPTAKQTAALLMNSKREMLYGGAAGGGKSVFLLTAALQYVDVPNYAAILFRKTYADLMLPHALIPMSQEWLAPYLQTGEVQWKDKDKIYVFHESGATLSFGYMENKDDWLRYQGAEFQFVGMDEVTHIMLAGYTYMFSRLRRLKTSNIPLRMRASANPGGPYGDDYYNRFFVQKKGVFLPAGLADNPYLDVEEYRESLSELDEVTRQQLEEGNWEIRAKGDLFNKEWLIFIDPKDYPAGIKWVRFWDLASIDPKYRKKNTNTREPDWTVGFKMGFYKGNYYIDDISRAQKRPGDIETLIVATTQSDGYSCAVRMEEEGGASGANTTMQYTAALMGYDFMGVSSVSSKIERARPVATAAQTGRLFINKRCRNLLDFLIQLEAFPASTKDDMVDAMSGAFTYFNPNKKIYVPGSLPVNPRGRVLAVEHDVDDRYASPMGTQKTSYWHM